MDAMIARDGELNAVIRSKAQAARGGGGGGGFIYLTLEFEPKQYRMYSKGPK